MGKGKTIKDLRKGLKMTQVELANRIGVSKQTLYKYENDIITNIPSDKIELLADALHTTPAVIMGWKEPTHEEQVQMINKALKMTYIASKIPVLAEVPCGTPQPAHQWRNAEDFIEIEHSLAKTGEYYGLIAHGDSMYPKIEDGDIMIIHYQEDVESGQVAIVRINGDDATCKRIKKYHDGIELIPINPAYKPIYFGNEEVESLPVEIIGRVIEVRSKL